MNIAIFPSAFHPSLGGVEELVRQLAHELQRLGHAVIILTNRWPRDLPASELFEGLQVYRLAFRVPGGGWKQNLSYRMTHRRVQRETREILRRHQIDVLHLQCVSCNALYALQAAADLKLPLVVTLQGELTMDANRIFEHSAIAQTLLRRCLNEAAAVTGCSAKTIRDAEGFFGRPLPGAEVIFNASRIEDFSNAERWNHPRPYLFALGRLARQKGFDLLIDAFARAERISHDLLIAGEGSELAALKQQATHLGIADRVHFVGRADREKVASLFRGASFFVLPSRADEGLPVVCAEAMAAAKAVIATRSGGAPEAVLDGETGLIVEREDREALTQAIRCLCDDPELVRRFGKAGVLRAPLFSWSDVAKKYLAVYRKAGQTLPPTHASAGIDPVHITAKTGLPSREFNLPVLPKVDP